MMSQRPQPATPSKTITTNKPNRLVLVDREMLRKAQRVIKSAPDNTWYWKLCMRMAKQAYGINCKEPLPELGERNGNYICTYVNKEKGEYSFSLIHSEIKHNEARHD